jgi:hypothetical protein
MIFVVLMAMKVVTEMWFKGEGDMSLRSVGNHLQDYTTQKSVEGINDK